MAVAIALALSVLLFCVLYVWSRFAYTFEQAHLRIEWRLPPNLPFNSTRVAYDQIAEIRPFSWRADASGIGQIWGNLPSRGSLIVRLRPKGLRRGVLCKLWLSPGDTRAFVEAMASRGVPVEHVA